MKWPVVPICDAQLTDVNPNDILCNGLYRRCNTYKGGGGYDKFPEIYQRRFGYRDNLNDQFVVQLKGCPLHCPYCYVTKEGIWGKEVEIDTDTLVQDFRSSKCEVFHLMGGAPTIYIEHWEEIIARIPDKVFHSDLLLVEKEYDFGTISRLANLNLSNCLYAVSIKGYGQEEFQRNTHTRFDEELFFSNLDLIVRLNLPFYFTYTGMSTESIGNFKKMIYTRYLNDHLFDDSFSIDVIHYNALDFEKKG